jgi:hypothetical protein
MAQNQSSDSEATGTIAHLLTGLKTLFPVPPASKRPARSTVPLYLAAFIVVTAVCVIRQNGIPPTYTLWAEDGLIFYPQAVTHPFFSTLGISYGGYLQLFPRLAIQVARLFPLRDVPTAIAIGGAMCLAALALLVFAASRGHIHRPITRLLMVASMILLLIAPGELFDNFVNMGWWLFYASFWMLLWRPTGVFGKMIAGIVCLLATGTDPIVALFLPLAAARVVAVRNVREHAPTLGLIAGLAYQGYGHVHGPSQRFTTTSQGVTQLFFERVGLVWLTGDRFTNDILASHRGVAFVAGLLLFAGISVVAMTRPDLRWFTVFAGVLCVVTFVVPVWLRGAAPSMSQGSVELGSRYLVVPVLLLTSMFLAASDRMTLTVGRRNWGIGALLCAALLVPSWTSDFRHSNTPTTNPTWSSQIRDASAMCRRSSRGGIELAFAPPGWTVRLPCPLFRELNS